MARGKILERWFHEPTDVFTALQDAHEVDTIYDSDNEIRQAVIQREGVSLRLVATESSETLLEVTEIEVYALDPTVTCTTQGEQTNWEDRLGEAVHTELLDLLEAPTAPVTCSTCEFSFVA